MKKIQVIKGDITTMKVDAIVNAANAALSGGGGVDGAIHQAAGLEELNAACRKFDGCAPGEAVITPGFKLPAKYIIHTPGPIWRGGTHNEAAVLANSYRNSLQLADAHHCTTVAFPSISTGVYRYPLEQAATIALTTLKKALGHTQFVETVTMVCFDAHTFSAYQTALAALEAK